MMRHRRRLLLGVVALLLVMTAACDGGSGSPLLGGTPQDTTAITQSGGGDGGTDSSVAGTSPLGGSDSPITAAGADPARPLAIQEGLGTFDSYEWRMSMKTVGPTPADITEITIEWSYSSADDARLARTTSTISGPDYEQPESSTLEVYTVGNRSCEFDGGEWSSQEITDQQREALEAARSLFDISVVPSDPTLVGSESIAGIPAGHYMFVVPGLGQDSGAVVTSNQVDYWVAEGSRALVKYLAVVETRSAPESDPNADVFHIETSTELISANQPLSISLPAECPEPEPVEVTTETSTPPVDETTTTSIVEAGAEPTTYINVRRFGDLVGTMIEVPSCFAIEQSAGTTIGATVTGIVGVEAYSVSAIVTGVAGPGTYPTAELSLSTIENDQLIESIGTGDAVVSFPATDVARLEFDITLNGDAGRARLVGSLTCSIAE